MNFDDDPKAAAFRAEVRAFLEAHAPEGGLGYDTHDLAALARDQRRWQARLFEHGWAVPSWPAEWGGRGIRLNAIAPGPFPTEGAWERLVPDPALEETWRKKIPLGRFGEHAELANLAAYLAADGSAYVNGEVVTIDGGEWLKGAAQFALMEQLSDEDWAAMKKR